jgi:hypothetical protein
LHCGSVIDLLLADYWIFIIAICTYLLLTDNKKQSTWIQDHRVILWALPWFFSLLCGGLGLGLIGYGYNGAYCLFTSDKVRLLINYVPRWIIILTILFLYFRLYFLVHCVHKETTSLASNLSTNPENSLRTQDQISRVDDIEQGRRSSGRPSGSSQRRLKRVCFLQPQRKLMLNPTGLLPDDVISTCIHSHLHHPDQYSYLPIFDRKNSPLCRWNIR